jgi:hypothetical protein
MNWENGVESNRYSSAGPSQIGAVRYREFEQGRMSRSMGRSDRPVARSSGKSNTTYTLAHTTD